MKYLLLLLCFLSAEVASAQLHYTDHVLELNNEKLIIRRSSQKQLDSFQHWSAIAHRLSIFTGRLQKHLDDAQSAILDKREVYEFYLQSAQEQIDKLHAIYPNYDIKVYEAELAAYKRYKARQEAAENP